MNWKQLIRHTQQLAPYRDRQKRECRELHDITIVFATAQDAQKPLAAVREMGWLYPSNEELKAVLLGDTEGYAYSYAKNVQEALPHIQSLLKAHPSTRRATIVLTTHMTYSHPHIPTLLSATFRIVDNKLHITCVCRSVDLIVGLPANAYQLSILLTDVSERLSVPAGTVTLFMNSAHTFADQDEYIEKIFKNRKS